MKAEKGKQKASAAPETSAGAGAAAAKKVKQPEKSKVRRIHVSGLPAISEADVKDRFKSFGTVTGVDGLGKLDGNGNPLRYAFVDIDITKSKLAQCMNLLSGSVWKGSTLRIAEAKPTFMDRIAREREQASQKAAETSTTDTGSEQTSKKRKRADGIQSKDIELANGENVKNRAGWKLDPQSSTPIFPIVARPDHPLPALPSSKKAEKAKVQPAAKVKADGKKDKKALKKEKAAAAAAAAPVDPPNRAQRVKIDPTKWQPKHLREKEFPRTSASGSSAMPNLEESEEEQASTSGYSDSDADSASSEASGEPDEREDESEEDMPLVSESATRKTDNQVASAAPIDSDSSDAGATERKRQMDLIASMLGGRLPESISASEIEKVAAGADFNAALSSDSSTSSEEEADLVPEDADVMETVSNDVEKAPQEIAVQEDELAVNDGVAESASTSSSEEDEPAEEDAPTQPAAPTIQMQSLTEMFKPQESVAGFTLGGFLDDLDLDLEELPELGAGSGPVASETAQPLYRSAAPPTRSQPVLQRAGAYDPHEPLFFPFPFEEDDQPGGLIHGMPESQKKELLERSWTGTSTFKRFKRTQNIEEITTQYEAARKVLNEQVRKRHREAAKRRKRSGGRGDRKVDADDDE